MRILGERSLVTVLKLITDVGYYGALGVAVLIVVVVVVIATALPSSLNVNLELPARFDIDPAIYEIAHRDRAESQAVIGQAQGNVQVIGVQREQAVQAFAVAGVMLVVAVFILWQFRGLFRSLKDGQPFVHANVRRIRMLGLAVIGGELLRAATIAWTSHRLGRVFESDGISFRAEFDPSGVIIFVGLLLLVLAEVFREAATMKRDLETAREIQFTLVPGESFSQDSISVRSRMRPANTVGGDYYDVIPLEEHRVAVIQADVAGKGMPAALLMAVLQGSLRTLVSAGFRGARLVGELNNYLNDNTPSNRMVTLFYGELDTTTGEMSYVNAGHNPPFHLRGDGRLDRPGTSSMVLGIMPDMSFEEAALKLEPGERLLLYTDGISEAADSKDTEYGDERVGRFLAGHRGETADRLVHAMIRDVLGFCKPGRPADDMTLMLIGRE